MLIPFTGGGGPAGPAECKDMRTWKVPYCRHSFADCRDSARAATMRVKANDSEEAWLAVVSMRERTQAGAPMVDRGVAFFIGCVHPPTD